VIGARNQEQEESSETYYTLHAGHNGLVTRATSPLNECVERNGQKLVPALEYFNIFLESEVTLTGSPTWSVVFTRVSVTATVSDVNARSCRGVINFTHANNRSGENDFCFRT
jgi:hypothetical protein